MHCEPTEELPEVIVVTPDVFTDSRGSFLETYRRERYREAGIDVVFVQDNLSSSVRGVLRGLHYQIGRPQGKLVWAVAGEVFDVAVDIRRGSPRFGHWAGRVLSADDHRQIYIPPGFAHGFATLSERALVAYKCTDSYDPASERGIRWDDPALDIAWPVDDPILSDRDRAYPALVEVPPGDLPVHTPANGASGR